MATATDNCDTNVAVTYTDQVSGTCPKTITRTWKATDDCGNYSTCVQTITCTMPSLVTNSSLCTFDVDPSTTKHDFRLIYTQDPQNMPSYKLNASNPGQFFYNVFFKGTAGSTVTLNLSIPYPFETQGANPVHAYDGVTTSTSGGVTCLTPGNPVPLTATPQTIDVNSCGAVSSGSPTIVMVTVTMPATECLYVNIHLDYGLKGCGGYAKGGLSANDAVAAGTTTVLIPDKGNYTFSVGGSLTDDDSVCNINDFKKNPGVAGLSSNNLTRDPVPGATVTLKNASGQQVGAATSDQDGFYQINYKHTGPRENYTVKIVKGSFQQTKTVELKANAFVQVDFTVP
jgi:hypothetical protein